VAFSPLPSHTSTLCDVNWQGCAPEKCDFVEISSAQLFFALCLPYQTFGTGARIFWGFDQDAFAGSARISKLTSQF
jgi:hypothetical protein